MSYVLLSAEQYQQLISTSAAPQQSQQAQPTPPAQTSYAALLQASAQNGFNSCLFSDHSEPTYLPQRIAGADAHFSQGTMPLSQGPQATTMRHSDQQESIFNSPAADRSDQTQEQDFLGNDLMKCLDEPEAEQPKPSAYNSIFSCPEAEPYTQRTPARQSYAPSFQPQLTDSSANLGFVPQAQPFFPKCSAEVRESSDSRAPSPQGSNSEEKQRKGSFEFPEGGWECSVCQNYNFKGRSHCFRCKKQKSTEDFEGMPEHLLKSKKGKLCAQAKPFVPGASSQRRETRDGDWKCFECSNYNYSFRGECNKCGMTQFASRDMEAARQVSEAQQDNQIQLLVQSCMKFQA